MWSPGGLGTPHGASPTHFRLNKRKRSTPKTWDEAIIAPRFHPYSVFVRRHSCDFNAVLRRTLFRHTLESGRFFSESALLTAGDKALCKIRKEKNPLSQRFKRDVEFSFVVKYFITAKVVCQGGIFPFHASILTLTPCFSINSITVRIKHILESSLLE